MLTRRHHLDVSRTDKICQGREVPKKNSTATSHPEHRFPALSSKEGCRKPLLGVSGHLCSGWRKSQTHHKFSRLSFQRSRSDAKLKRTHVQPNDGLQELCEQEVEPGSHGVSWTVFLLQFVLNCWLFGHCLCHFVPYNNNNNSNSSSSSSNNKNNC